MIDRSKHKITIDKTISEFDLSDQIFGNSIDNAIDILQRLKQEPILLGLDNIKIEFDEFNGLHLIGSFEETDEMYRIRMKKISDYDALVKHEQEQERKIKEFNYQQRKKELADEKIENRKRNERLNEIFERLYKKYPRTSGN